MTTKDLCYINLVDKVATRFKRIDSSFSSSSVVGRILSDSFACYRDIICAQLYASISRINMLKKREGSHSFEGTRRERPIVRNNNILPVGQLMMLSHKLVKKNKTKRNTP